MIEVLRKYLAQGNPEWAVRRRLVVALTIFCCAIIVWALGWIPSDSRSENAVNQAFYILFAIITVYIGGVVADDALKSRQPGTKISTKKKTEEIIEKSETSPDESVVKNSGD